MGMSEREHHIKVLENLLSHYKAREKCEGYYDNTLKDNVEALEYAISSLKTDEAYQIMYEGGEVFTKDEVVNMLVELNSEIRKLQVKREDQLDAGINIGVIRCSNLVWREIDKLKETKDYGNKTNRSNSSVIRSRF